jgi:hypothetical protein
LPIRRKKAECEVTSGDRTIGRNIDWNPTSSMRFKETERHSTHDCRNWKRDDRRRKKDDDEEAEMRRSRRKFTKRIGPISNLLMPDLIKGSSKHEIMKQSGEN